MRFIKRVLGFNSPYSWIKWLRMSFAAVALFIALAFWFGFGFMITDGGVFGLIFALIIFVIIFGPTVAVLLGISVGVGAIIGGVLSGRKQIQSLRESEATGDSEMVSLDKLRIKVQVGNLLFYLATAVWLIGSVALYSIGSALRDSGGSSGVFTLLTAFVFFGGLVAVAAFWLAKRPANKQYQESFKDQIVRKGLESVLASMSFDPDAKLDESIIKDSQLFTHYDLYDGNDYLAAEYKGIRFIQADAHLREMREETYRDSNGDMQTRTRYVTVFQGRLMVFDFDTISEEPVFVLPRGHRKPGKDDIRTELDSFNNRFSVTAKDATAAFRILTPPVLEGIALASDRIGCPILLSFKNDKIYVGISSGDAFEASARGDATLSEQRGRVARDIQTILDMVETLYLGKR